MDISGLAHASMQLQTNRNPARVSPKVLMILDTPEITQNRGAKVRNPDSGVVQHSMLVEYPFRSPLQDCTNENIQQVKKDKVGSSVAGKGQWNRRARMQGADLQENTRPKNFEEEEGNRKIICLM